MGKIYTETLPNKIKTDTEAFDNTVIEYSDSPLIDEISDNLNECKTMQEKERYLHTLIVPFKELSDLLHPEFATKQRIDNELSIYDEFEEHKRRLIDEYKRLEMISERFRQILNEPTDDVEKSLRFFHFLSLMFVNKLDALCLQNGIDFMKLQKDCGTCMKKYRSITDVEDYVGSYELAKKYINELNTDPSKQAVGKSHKITIPGNVLNWLQETRCSNGKPFIKKAMANTCVWDWLQNKELARLLLTHTKIKGSLTIAEVERQTPALFFYPKDNKPLELASPKRVKSIDCDTLNKFLATLQVIDL